MNTKVKIGSHGGVFTLLDKYYKTAGGEASIYANGGNIFKIYHDKKKSLQEQKLRELSSIQNSHVIVPKDLVFDASTGETLGYTAPYIDNVEPLLKFFTKTFKQDNNVDHKIIAELIKQLQLITSDIHKANCLIVDFNELNVLVNISPNVLTPYFIDVDSYATPNFKATAIMDSVRDRRVSKTVNNQLIYNPDILSDWFSWGILSFWLYTNIHPYRGNHPNYKPKDKQKQMDDGISVFHKGVRVPPTVNDFNIIPKRHKDWFEAVFFRNERSIPPLADSMTPAVVPTSIVVIQGNDNIEVKEVGAYPEDIINIINLMGVNYVITHKKIYAENKEMLSGIEKAKKVLLCNSPDGTVIVANLTVGKVTFSELHNKQIIGTIDAQDMFFRNNCIYTVIHGKLVENSFSTVGNKLIHRITELENISTLTTTIFDGCIIQDLLGRKHITVPYAKGTSKSCALPELDKFRIIDAKMDKTVAIIIAEKGGRYDRFVISFKKDYSIFDVRKVEDIAYDGINFTVLDTGVCVLLANNDELELFVNNQNVTVLSNPPFDSNMKLISLNNQAYFIQRNSIFKIKKK